MSNTKCPRCGLVNWSSDEACERCAAPLAGGAPEAPDAAEVTVPPVPEATTARPDLPGLSLSGYAQSGSNTGKVVVLVILAVVLCTASAVV